MSHDAALEAHEHAEHAEHAAQEHDPFIARVAITVAVLAVLAAVAGSVETVEGGRALGRSSEAVLEQDKATDAWSEYQSESLKKHMYTIAAAGGGPNADNFRQTAKEESEMQDKVRAEAKADEVERDKALADSERHEDRHHWLTGSATLFEIGIAMSTVAIITRRRWLWFGAVGFAVAGCILFGLAYAL